MVGPIIHEKVFGEVAKHWVQLYHGAEHQGVCRTNPSRAALSGIAVDAFKNVLEGESNMVGKYPVNKG